jgi:phospholipase D-like protein
MANRKFELIDGKWLSRFEEAFGANCGNLRLMAPFIKEGAIRQLLHARQLGRIRVLTRFDLEDCRAGVQDLEALRLLLRRKASVKGIKGLHSKLYIFDDRTAILGSVNLTGAALRSNHELGVQIFEADAVHTCTEYFDRLWKAADSTLTEAKIDRWKREVEAAGTSDKQPSRRRLKDHGSEIAQDAGAELPPVESVKTLGRQVFVKFFGLGTRRIPASQSVLQTVQEDGSHWACTYGTRPHQPNDGDIVYFARMVKEGSDHRIYGRGIALKYVAGRDEATKSEIDERDWKKNWPYYIRIHDAEFIDGKLQDCPSLLEMFEELDAMALARTSENAQAGSGNRNPRRSIMRKPATLLAPIGAAWLRKRFEARLKKGSIPSAALGRLDWPDTAKWLSSAAKAMLEFLVLRLESGELVASDPDTFPNYMELARALGIAQRPWSGLGPAVRRNGLDDLDEWTRRFGFPAITGLIVYSGSRPRPGQPFFDLHGHARDAEVWWPREMRRVAAYPWRNHMG